MNSLYKNINILVIGDSCTDIFTYGNVPRIAPEGPAPVFNPIEVKSNGGMALNVKTKHTIDYLDIYKKLIITHSDKGCEYNSKMFPVKRVNCKDMSGAGDTFISGLTCEFARSKNINLAIKFAQECATKVVQKLGVCTI